MMVLPTVTDGGDLRLTQFTRFIDQVFSDFQFELKLSRDDKNERVQRHSDLSKVKRKEYPYSNSYCTPSMCK